MTHRQRRPIYSQDQILSLCDQILRMTPMDDVRVTVEHTARSILQWSDGSERGSDQGEELRIMFSGGYNVYGIGFTTDVIDPDTLRGLIQRAQNVMKSMVGEDQKIIVPDQLSQDTYLPVQLWHDSTVDVMQSGGVEVLPPIIQSTRQQGLVPSGYLGLFARARGTMVKNQVKAYYEETDSELSVNARTADGTGAGWAGQANRAWDAIDVAPVVAQATDLAHRSMNPMAVEPGRMTTIFTREAVAQLMRYFWYFLDIDATELDRATPFWRDGFPPNRVGQKMFDERITITSDPEDAEGGYAPYYGDALRNSKMLWTDQGVLKCLAAGAPKKALSRKWAYTQPATSIRISGGPTTIDQMIAQCKLGVFVNHVGHVILNDAKDSLRAGVMTGVTRNGCFLVQDGKIKTPIRNFRFVDSPIIMLNNVIALGEPRRAAFGYTPPADQREYMFDWPRPPMIVPPMMVRDFTFTGLVDAV